MNSPRLKILINSAKNDYINNDYITKNSGGKDLYLVGMPQPEILVFIFYFLVVPPAKQINTSKFFYFRHTNKQKYFAQGVIYEKRTQ